MASHKTESFNERMDIANSIIRQCNSCPICHLPLRYGIARPAADLPVSPRVVSPRSPRGAATRLRQPPVEPAEAPLSPKSDTLRKSARLAAARAELEPHDLHAPTADEKWDDLRNVLPFYAADPSRVNAEKCHLVGRTMIQEVTKPELYNTPAHTGFMYPEDGMYLNKSTRRQAHLHKIFQWDIPALFKKATTAGLLRVQNFLTTTGTHYFIACNKCNAAHTGDDQLQQIFKSVFHGALKDDQDVFVLYTLIFDSMADCFDALPASIRIDKKRIKLWNVEIWLNYCGFMLIAQFFRHLYFYSLPIAGRYNHMIHNAHKDIGMCDFYLNQILAAILYVNYKIDIDFIWLHQNFLVHLPQWAKDKGYYKTADTHFNCMWRWVLGHPTTTQPQRHHFWPMVDVGMSEGHLVHDPATPNFYWMQGNATTLAKLIVDRVTLFARHGLPIIANAIQPTPSGELSTLFNTHCSKEIQKKLAAVRYQPCYVAAAEPTLLVQSMIDPTLETFQCAFNAEFTGGFKKVLYGNYVHISVARTRYSTSLFFFTCFFIQKSLTFGPGVHSCSANSFNFLIYTPPSPIYGITLGTMFSNLYPSAGYAVFSNFSRMAI